jgi:hypothetical protein
VSEESRFELEKKETHRMPQSLQQHYFVSKISTLLIIHSMRIMQQPFNSYVGPSELSLENDTVTTSGDLSVHNELVLSYFPICNELFVKEIILVHRIHRCVRCLQLV